MTPRSDAALALAHAEARVIEARTTLRDAVKAEIAAMPDVGDGEGFAEIVTVVRDVLRENTGAQHMHGRAAAKRKIERKQATGWLMADVGREGVQVYVCAREGGIHLEMVHRMATFTRTLSGGHLGSAMRDALAWLADRDVFVEVRS